MKKLILSICLFLSFSSFISGKYNDDLITMPSYPSNYDFEVYSGYLENKSDSGMPTHYIF